jgi:hypothetical protein
MGKEPWDYRALMGARQGPVFGARESPLAPQSSTTARVVVTLDEVERIAI